MIAVALKPPFTLETATAKVQRAESLWNTRDPERVAMAYTVDSKWRNRSEFLEGREAIRQFLKRKWAQELDYRLKKTLWGFRDSRMAGQWFRSYGVELWEFDDEGLMRERRASINDAPIQESERRIF